MLIITTIWSGQWKKKEKKKSFLFLSQICTCQSKTASNKPLGLRNSREEPRSSLRGFRSGVKLIFSWQFDSPLSLTVLLLLPQIIIDFGAGFLIWPVNSIYGCLAFKTDFFFFFTPLIAFNSILFW